MYIIICSIFFKLYLSSLVYALFFSVSYDNDYYHSAAVSFNVTKFSLVNINKKFLS